MGADAQHKAAFRRWARQYHPDVGGDPELFDAGVQAVREGRWAEFEARFQDSENAEGVAVAAESPAPHAPGRTIVYVARSVHGVSRLVVAAKKWKDRRHAPPRVL